MLESVNMLKVIAWGLCLLSAVALAQGVTSPAPVTPPDMSTPDGMIKAVVSEVMAAVKADPEIQKGNIPRIVELVEKKIVPNADMRRTTEMAMGANWKKQLPNSKLNSFRSSKHY